MSDSILSMPKQVSTPLLPRLHIDLPLLTGILLLCAFGLAMLYSASDSDIAMVRRQLVNIAVALAVMLALAQLSPAKLKAISPWFYLAGLLLLAAVLVMGDMGKGAQRWLLIGSFRFQPSEIVKIAVPMMCAGFLSSRPQPVKAWHLLVAFILTLIPAALIIKQPDLGTAILVAAAGVFTLFYAGLSWRLIILLFVIAIGAVSAVLYDPDILDMFLLPYQKRRVLTLIDPQNDPLGAGYHIIQSSIAIGSGGMFGKGWLNGTQCHLDFLPEQHTDFIFAVIAEEIGLAGIIIMMMLYFFIILRGLYIAAMSDSTYGRLLGGSLTLVFFIYLLVNTGMVTGILPVVGVPLPLVSYGGTSIITIMAGFGILMSIHTHRELSRTRQSEITSFFD
ncbi:MAG: rod shape-determining protein RodA [Gammaproteobacteria bacterium]|nr:rod shape-determining protein RodA [Gammaproteobacteria bacterium]